MQQHELVVRKGKENIGRVDVADGRLRFRYLPDGERLSAALPPQEAPQPGTFFANLLPEGELRERIAGKLGVAAADDFALLKALAGDCAGAYSVVDPAAPDPQLSAGRKALPSSALADVAGFLAGGGGVRLCLAGVQAKLPVVREADGSLSVPVGSAASTHILKLPNERWPGLVDNELFMLRLAAACGLPTVRAARHGNALLVERFDRRAGERLHQEDFCQALGVPPERKYEAAGGPDLPALVGLVRAVSSDAGTDVPLLLRWQIFNTLAGNADGHAKNLAFLRTSTVRLAPCYDLVCTRQWKGLGRRLALRVGEVGDPAAILPQHWRACAKACGFDGDAMIALVHDVADRLTDQVGPVGDAVVGEGADGGTIRAVTKAVRDLVRTTKRRLARA